VENDKKIKYTDICIKTPNSNNCVIGESFLTFALNKNGQFDLEQFKDDESLLDKVRTGKAS